MRIAGFASDDNACGRYRLIYPMACAKMHGVHTEVFHEVCYEDALKFDIIVAQRVTSSAVVDLLKRLKDAGKTIIAETDDLLESVHPTNPAFSFFKMGSSDLKNYLEVLELAHGIVVSTQELKDHYLPLNKNIHVVPNFIDFGLRKWPQPHFNTDVINVGWTGSTSHINDIEAIGNTMQEILRKYPQTRYTHYGHEELLKRLKNNYDLPEDRINLIHMVPFDKHPENMSSIDIGLAPLHNNEFNRAKSHLKILEYSACGIPFVASKVAPYQRYTDDGVDGFIVDTPSEWIDRVSLLIENQDTRKKMADAGYNKATEFNDISKNSYRWIEAWAAIHKAALSNDVGRGNFTLSKPGRNDACPCGSGKKYKKCTCYPAFG